MDDSEELLFCLEPFKVCGGGGGGERIKMVGSTEVFIGGGGGGGERIKMVGSTEVFIGLKVEMVGGGGGGGRGRDREREKPTHTQKPRSKPHSTTEKLLSDKLKNKRHRSNLAISLV